MNALFWTRFRKKQPHWFEDALLEPPPVRTTTDSNPPGSNDDNAKAGRGAETLAVVREPAPTARRRSRGTALDAGPEEDGGRGRWRSSGRRTRGVLSSQDEHPRGPPRTKHSKHHLSDEEDPSLRRFCLR